MGKQSSRMYFQGKDHKDIYFQGHYHDRMYIGSQMVWEKLKEELWKYYVIMENSTDKYRNCIFLKYYNGVFYYIAGTDNGTMIFTSRDGLEWDKTPVGDEESSKYYFSNGKLFANDSIFYMKDAYSGEKVSCKYFIGSIDVSTYKHSISYDLIPDNKEEIIRCFALPNEVNINGVTYRFNGRFFFRTKDNINWYAIDNYTIQKSEKGVTVKTDNDDFWYGISGDVVKKDDYYYFFIPAGSPGVYKLCRTSDFVNKEVVLDRSCQLGSTIQKKGSIYQLTFKESGRSIYSYTTDFISFFENPYDLIDFGKSELKDALNGYEFIDSGAEGKNSNSYAVIRDDKLYIFTTDKNNKVISYESKSISIIDSMEFGKDTYIAAVEGIGNDNTDYYYGLENDLLEEQ